MRKIIALWPRAFNQSLADQLRAQRLRVIDPDGLVILEEAAAIRRMNNMPGRVDPRVIEGVEVDRLAKAWKKWLAFAR